jgi:hypothetical protein
MNKMLFSTICPLQIVWRSKKLIEIVPNNQNYHNEMNGLFLNYNIRQFNIALKSNLHLDSKYLTAWKYRK